MSKKSKKGKFKRRNTKRKYNRKKYKKSTKRKLKKSFIKKQRGGSSSSKRQKVEAPAIAAPAIAEPVIPPFSQPISLRTVPRITVSIKKLLLAMSIHHRIGSESPLHILSPDIIFKISLKLDEFSSFHYTYSYWKEWIKEITEIDTGVTMPDLKFHTRIPDSDSDINPFNFDNLLIGTDVKITHKIPEVDRIAAEAYVEASEDGLPPDEIEDVIADAIRDYTPPPTPPYKDKREYEHQSGPMVENTFRITDIIISSDIIKAENRSDYYRFNINVKTNIPFNKFNSYFGGQYYDYDRIQRLVRVLYDVCTGTSADRRGCFRSDNETAERLLKSGYAELYIRCIVNKNTKRVEWELFNPSMYEHIHKVEITPPFEI